MRYVNTALVATYWFMGRRIVEYEQKGKERAKYGEALLKKISTDLTPQFGKGFTERNLDYMRQFYIIYPDISHTPCAKLPEDWAIRKPYTVGAKLIPVLQGVSGISEALMRKFPLSWSHYRLLMRIDEPFKREFYEVECIRGNWSVRQLDRQIQSMLYQLTTHADYLEIKQERLSFGRNLRCALSS